MFALENSPALIPGVVASAAAFVAGIIDVRSFKVPNLLTFPLCASGLAYHAVMNGGTGFTQSLVGVALGLCVLSFFYIAGAVGAGDVKLLAALGAWLGADITLWIFLVAALASGVYAVVVLAARGKFGTAFIVPRLFALQLVTLARHVAMPDRVEDVVPCSDRRWRLIPFALMVTIGVVIVMIGRYKLGLPGIS